MSLKCEITLSAPLLPVYRELDDCHTLGDHLRRERQRREHTQGFVAQKLGVTPDTVTNWELNRNEPTPPHIPNILAYLNYTPIHNLAGNTLPKRIEQYLYTHGVSQKELAQQIGIDEASLRRTREGKRVNTRTQKNVFEYILHIKGNAQPLYSS